jgi:hypothetical protein
VEGSQVDRDPLTGAAGHRPDETSFVPVLRVDATGRQPEFWRLGPDEHVRVDVAADEVAAVIGDDHPRLVVLLSGRIDLDAERCLRECEGFRVESVTGEPVGVVNALELDPQCGTVIGLVLCLGWFGRRRLTIGREDVVAILPSAERLILARPAESYSPPQRRGS